MGSVTKIDVEKLREGKAIFEAKFSYIKKALHKETLEKRVLEIENMSEEDTYFWAKPDSKILLKEMSRINNKLKAYKQIQQLLSDYLTLLELMEDNLYEVLVDLQHNYKKLEEKMNSFELTLILSEEADINNAIVKINAGAGGTEAEDWCEMLYRMYNRWADKKGFKLKIIDVIYGEEAGFDNVLFTIEGNYAYGYLKSEVGVHRLIRISPFDSNSKRHTSFAAVDVIPELNDDIEIVIDESDLKIDTFRAGGAGGQHVNTTDSAVRITHLPTGTIVACQKERSQHKNKSAALKVLKSKLYELELMKKKNEKSKKDKEKAEIGWGNQIRSYILQPYKMVKDLRTRFEVGNADAVLNGNIDGFIKAYLIHNMEDKNI